MGWGRTSFKLTNSIFNVEKIIPEGQKTVKEVFSNSVECCHVWASGSLNRGRSTNIFFEGNKIYSYGRHYLAAQIFELKNGDSKAVLINSDRNSNTTYGHLSDIRRATSHMIQITVPDTDPRTDHSTNLEFLEEALFNFAEKTFTLKTRIYNWGDEDNIKEELESFQKLVEAYNSYLKIFNLKGSIDLKSKSYLTTIETLNESLKACKKATAERSEKRSLSRKLKEEKLNQKHKSELEKLEADFPAKFDQWVNGEISGLELSQFSSVSVIDGYVFGRERVTRITLSEETIEKFTQKAKEVLSDKIEAAKIQWRAGNITTNELKEVSNFSLSRRYWGRGDVDLLGKTALLRVSWEVVETSNFAEVPLSHAVRLLSLILKDQARKNERVGHYSLNSVSDLGEPIIEFRGQNYTEKMIKIGCHDILLSEALLVVGPHLPAELKIVKEEN